MNKKIIDYGFLPGGDIVKTLVFIAYTIILFFTICGPWSPDLLPEIGEKITAVILIISIIFCLLSSAMALTLQRSKLEEISNRYKLLIPKWLLEMGIFLVFSVVCFWVFILGGILKSPFGAILVISPFFFIIEFVRWRDISKYKNLALKWREIKKKDKGLDEITLEKEIKWYRYTNYINILIVIVIILTVSVGEYVVKAYNVNLLFLGSKMNYEMIVKTTWFLVLSYIFYYISLLIVLYGKSPPDITRNITKKIFL